MAKILLVEDDPMISEIYQRKFEASGFEVSIADTGKEVLAKIKKDHYDLILLDLVLPEMGGLDVLKEIKQSGKYDPRVKVLIFSNLSEKSDQDKAYELGADGFIPKSRFNPSQLVDEVKRMLNEYHENEANKGVRQNDGIIEANSDEAKKILLIEDEEVFLDIFGQKLTHEGYQVTIEKNGPSAIKRALNESFDLIVTDMMVEAMNGEEIIKNLKKEKKTKNIPVVVLSASFTEEELSKVNQLGIVDYFVKTKITPSELAKKIKSILGG